MEDMFKIAEKDLVDFDIWFKKKDYSRSSYYLQQAEEKTAKGILANFGLLGEKNTPMAQLFADFGIPVFSADIDYNHPWSKNLLKQLRSIYTGSANVLLKNLTDLDPLKLIDNALAIGYDADANEQKAEEFAEGVKRLLDLLPDVKNGISQRISEIKLNLNQSVKKHKEKVLPIIKTIAEKSNVPKSDLSDTINIIDNGSVSDALGEEKINKILEYGSIYYSLIESATGLISLAIFDTILRYRETSRYPSEEPKFKEAQINIKEQIEHCINIGKELEPIDSIASKFYFLN